MNDTESTKSLWDLPIRILYQLMLAAGSLFLVYAVYLIAGGTTEAILMFLPGLFTLGGGIVLRKIFSYNRFA